MESAADTRRRNPARLTPAASAVAASAEAEAEAEAEGSKRSGIAPTLRRYQLDAIAAIEAEWSRGRKTLLVLATGAGKTVVFAELVRRKLDLGGRALVLAHRRELLEQAAKKLRDLGIDVAVEQGKKYADSGSRCVVASVDTLRGARLLSYPESYFTCVVVDEAHHAVAPKYQEILKRFRSALLLGVTATPDRLDGKGLGKVFDSVAYRYEMGKAISDGWLCPLEIRHVRVDRLNLDDVSTKAGDFDRTQLSAAMRNSSVVDETSRWISDRVAPRRSIVFCVDNEHCVAVESAINKKSPGTARSVSGRHSAHDRSDVLAKWRRGEFSILVNCELFTEGFDEPSIEAIVLLRPTQSRALYTQIVGRGTRLSPGKESCLILDVVGNSRRHRLASSADALIGSGDASDQIRAEIEKLLEAGHSTRDVDKLIAQAAQNVLGNEEQQGLAQVLAFRERLVDPFLAPYLQGTDVRVGRPITAMQLSALAQIGIDKPPPSLSSDEATRWINAAFSRRRKGLCTIRQGLFLGKWGLDCSEMPMGRATELVMAFKQLGVSAFKAHAFRQPEWKSKK